MTACKYHVKQRFLLQIEYWYNFFSSWTNETSVYTSSLSLDLWSCKVGCSFINNNKVSYFIWFELKKQWQCYAVTFSSLWTIAYLGIRWVGRSVSKGPITHTKKNDDEMSSFVHCCRMHTFFGFLSFIRSFDQSIKMLQWPLFVENSIDFFELNST